MRARNFKQRKFRIFFTVAFAAAVLVVLYAVAWRSPMRGPATIEIPRGASVSGVANRMAAAGVIDSAKLFKLVVRGMGGRIQIGEYEIPARASVWRVARMLSRGDVATTTVVIPEGMTVQQIKQLLLRSSALTGPVECDPGYTAAVCDLRDGDLFPDTYRVAKGTSRLAFLELMRKKMTRIESSWRGAGRAAPAPLRAWDEVLTLASIVQKETPRESEMPLVASVYLNRLRANMRLQADPTVVYALTNGYGDMRGAPLLRGHLKIESPYNTYTNRGLPPGPIANVGRAAIRAVLNPADTNYLFFVADGRGGHKFANSYQEHMRNHADWREIKKIRNGK